MERYKIYSDGSCLGNPGFGGHASVILKFFGDICDTTIEVADYEHDSKTTNNRQEIKAVMIGLLSIPEGSIVEVVSDSQYVIGTMKDGWARKKNQDLWEDLDSIVNKLTINWTWIKGHNGDKFQERADTLAKIMSKIAMEFHIRSGNQWVGIQLKGV